MIFLPLVPIPDHRQAPRLDLTGNSSRETELALAKLMATRILKTIPSPTTRSELPVETFSARMDQTMRLQTYFGTPWATLTALMDSLVEVERVHGQGPSTVIYL